MSFSLAVLYNCTDMAAVPIVVDTSAIMSVLTHEEHRPVLIRLTQDAELLAPSSLPVELGNAFSAMFTRGRTSPGEAKAALEMFRQIPIHLTEIDLARALELSHELGVYAYDAYVIACSLEHRAPLLTLDTGQQAAARRAGVTVLEIET